MSGYPKTVYVVHVTAPFFGRAWEERPTGYSVRYDMHDEDADDRLAAIQPDPEPVIGEWVDDKTYHEYPSSAGTIMHVDHDGVRCVMLPDDSYWVHADDYAKLKASAGTVSVEAAPDHQPFMVPEIGNYYGGLCVKREGGKDFWSIENYDGHDWIPCDPAVASALRALAGDTP